MVFGLTKRKIPITPNPKHPGLENQVFRAFDGKTWNYVVDNR